MKIDLRHAKAWANRIRTPVATTGGTPREVLQRGTPPQRTRSATHWLGYTNKVRRRGLTTRDFQTRVGGFSLYSCDFNRQVLSKGIAILVGVVIVLTSIEGFAGIPAQMNVSNSSSGEKTTSPEQIRAIVRQARDSWVNGDADAFAALFTPDGELIVPGQKWVGRKAIRQAAADFANYASNVKIEIRQIIIEGDRAAVEWYWEDTEKATGRRNRADDAIIADFVAGKIKRWREYIDKK